MEWRHLQGWSVLLMIGIFGYLIIDSHIGRYLSRNSTYQMLGIGSGLERENSRGSQRPVVRGVSCRLLWTGDKNETAKALTLQGKTPRKFKTVDDFRANTWSCGRYINNGGFKMAAVSKEERAFPIAFSLVVYKDADQVEWLMRAIYRPHNVYCLHVDSKTDNAIRAKLMMMAGCLTNVFVSTKAVDVKWGGFTNLQPEVICMQELWNRNITWQYFINLTGQEFPLKTNKELVRILQAFKGANSIYGDSTRNNERWNKFLPAPYNLTIYKGSLHIVASRAFVDYVLHSKVAKDLLAWVKKTAHPDESYFNTLNHNPQLGVPGSVNLNHTKGLLPAFNRHKIWYDKRRCAGKMVRSICHFGVGDLPRLVRAPNLFANKFSYEYQPLAYDCLEEWYWNKVKLEEEGRQPWPLNITFYSKSKLTELRYTGPVKIW